MGKQLNPLPQKWQRNSVLSMWLEGTTQNPSPTPAVTGNSGAVLVWPRIWPHPPKTVKSWPWTISSKLTQCLQILPNYDCSKIIVMLGSRRPPHPCVRSPPQKQLLPQQKKVAAAEAAKSSAIVFCAIKILPKHSHIHVLPKHSHMNVLPKHSHFNV